VLDSGDLQMTSESPEFCSTLGWPSEQTELVLGIGTTLTCIETALGASNSNGTFRTLLPKIWLFVTF